MWCAISAGRVFQYCTLRSQKLHCSVCWKSLGTEQKSFSVYGCFSGAPQFMFKAACIGHPRFIISLTNPAFLHKLYPEVYLTNSCTKCGSLATLHHMRMEYPSVRGTYTPSSSKWESALRSPAITPQLWAVQGAHNAAAGFGLTVLSWEWPAVC